MAAVKYLLKKEFLLFRRDKFLSLLAVIFPMAVMLLMPWAANLDVKEVNLAVIDHDGSSLSSRLINSIEASENFILIENSATYSKAMSLIESGKADVVLEIPSGMEKDLSAGQDVEVFIASNSVNSVKGIIGASYLNSIVSSFPVAQTTQTVPVDVRIQFKYNKYLDYKMFMVPGFLLMIILCICSFLPALNIVMEKERGTIEQINVTPVSKLEFILSKILFYGILGIILFSIGFFFSKAIYGIAPYGGYIPIFIATVLFILFMSGIGLLLSNVSQTLQQCVFLIFFTGNIMLLLTGVITPVQSMENWAQNMTYFLPPRYYIDIMRAVCLKGSGILDLGFEFIMLGLSAFITDLFAVLTYKKQS